MPTKDKKVEQTIEGPKGEVTLVMDTRGFRLSRPDVSFSYVKPVTIDLCASDITTMLREIPYKVEKCPISEPKRWERDFGFKDRDYRAPNYAAEALESLGSLDIRSDILKLYLDSNSTVVVNTSTRVQVNTQYVPPRSIYPSQLNVVGVNDTTLSIAQQLSGLSLRFVPGTGFVFRDKEPSLEQLAKDAAAKAKTELCIDEAYKLFQRYRRVTQEMSPTERALLEYLKR